MNRDSKTYERFGELSRAGERGTSALGLVVSTLIFSVLLVGAMGVITSGRNMVASGVERSDLMERAHSLCGRVAKDLLASRVTVDPAGGSRLEFRKNRGGVDGATGEVNWTAESPLIYAFQYAPGEADNDQDDNGNRIVDEGEIVRIEDGVTTVVTTGVAEGGLAFTRRGERIRIDLTLVGLDGRGELVSVNASRFVYPRN